MRLTRIVPLTITTTGTIKTWSPSLRRRASIESRAMWARYSMRLPWETITQWTTVRYRSSTKKPAKIENSSKPIVIGWIEDTIRLTLRPRKSLAKQMVALLIMTTRVKLRKRCQLNAIELTNLTMDLKARRSWARRHIMWICRFMTRSSTYYPMLLLLPSASETILRVVTRRYFFHQ